MIICIVFDLMMTVLMLLIGSYFVHSEGKAVRFLSGYNMKSEKERKKYNEKEMCVAYGNRILCMALPFVMGTVIDFLYNGIGCLVACVIWTIQFILLMRERIKREK